MIRTGKIITAGFIAAVMALAAGAANAKDKVKVGFIGPLTGGVSVIGADGTDKGLLKGFGDYVSNVQFRGSTLYVTDIGGGSGDDSEYHGSISRAELEGVTGLSLFPGMIA